MGRLQERGRIFPFSIANAVVGAESDANARRCAFGIQIVPV